MADAPAGGNGWGALEIILAVVLGIGVISTLTGTPITPAFSPSPNSTTVTPVQINNTSTITSSNYTCDITITNPHTGQPVSTSVTVTGIIKSCGGTAIPTTINGQIVDAKGTILSAYTPIVVNTGITPSSFNTTIPLSSAALSTKGYLIVAGVSTADGTTKDVRVPIVFTRQ